MLFLIFSFKEENISYGWSADFGKFQKICYRQFSRKQYEDGLDVTPVLPLSKKLSHIIKMYFQKETPKVQLREQLKHLEEQSELKTEWVTVKVRGIFCHHFSVKSTRCNRLPGIVPRPSDNWIILFMTTWRGRYKLTEMIESVTEDYILNIDEYY